MQAKIEFEQRRLHYFDEDVLIFCFDPAAEASSGSVLWCFYEQREVSQRDTAEVSKSTRETEMEKAKQEGWE